MSSSIENSPPADQRGRPGVIGLSPFLRGSDCDVLVVSWETNACSTGCGGGALDATNDPFKFDEEASPVLVTEVSKMLFDWGDPTGLEMTLPPFAFSEALAWSEVILGIVVEAEDSPWLILGESCNLERAVDTSFLGIDCPTLVLSSESPRFGGYFRCPVADACADLEESIDPRSVIR